MIKLIKAVDLEIGMNLFDGGYVSEVTEANGGYVEVTLSYLDYDCGEVEHLPSVFPVGEMFEIEV